MTKDLHLFSQKYSTIHPIIKRHKNLVCNFSIILLVSCINDSAIASDPELSNIKSGISLTFGTGDGSDKGTAYAEEYFYHDKMIVDRKVVYIKDATQIAMTHNSYNWAGDSRVGARSVAGAEQGIIRYRVDGDLTNGRYWSRQWGANLWPAYATPLQFKTLQYVGGKTVTGRTGNNGIPYANRTEHYQYGQLDQFGDEWHSIAVADDDTDWIKIHPDWYNGEGKSFLFVVNPKTPCLTVRATGNGQFYTTPPKAYFIPKINAQTTYFSPGTGTVTFDLRDINGNSVHYRINGGAWVEAQNPILNQSNFNDGTNTLEYYYTGNIAHTKTRIIEKNPTFPSLSENHGNLLWKDEGFEKILSRVTSSPNKEAYTTLRDNSYLNGRQAIFDSYRSGKRTITGRALNNAFQALIEGMTAKPAGFNLSYATYAKMAIMNNGYTMDSVGMEQSWGGPLPSRELNYRGYYDVNEIYDALFAYDILIANFRDTQVAGGITAIEDYFIRDLLASFAFQQLQYASNLSNGGTVGGMWDTARRCAALAVMLGLPNYSTPYFGTSGWNGNTTVYPWAPYPDDHYTWKQILWDDNLPLKGFPNLAFRLGIEEYNFTEDGTFADGVSYYSGSLMGHVFVITANLAAMHGNKRFPRYELSHIKAMKGTLRGTKKLDEEGARQFTNLSNYNNRFVHLLKDLTPHHLQSDPAKLAKEIGYSIYGIIWYDHGLRYTTKPTDLSPEK
ncbi:MAG: hypothetical protein AAB263_05275 [Planctomycetota bacterium]